MIGSTLIQSGGLVRKVRDKLKKKKKRDGQTNADRCSDITGRAVLCGCLDNRGREQPRLDCGWGTRREKGRREKKETWKATDVFPASFLLRK